MLKCYCVCSIREIHGDLCYRFPVILLILRIFLNHILHLMHIHNFIFFKHKNYIEKNFYINYLMKLKTQNIYVI